MKHADRDRTAYCVCVMLGREDHGETLATIEREQVVKASVSRKICRPRALHWFTRDHVTQVHILAKRMRI